MKYSERLVNKIVSLIEGDSYSITEICEVVKINRKTFYEWRDTKPEFRKAIEEAEERRDEELMITARRSLRRKPEGYTLRETKREYVPAVSNPQHFILTKEVVKEKEYPADTAAIKMMLERNDRKKKEKEELQIKEPKPWIIETTDPELGTVMRQAIERLQTWKKPG
ncbi:MAG: hypothetical protein LBV43_14430 [Prevotella sp.]|jgi:hypothetical protein|nr:hypothetical protein [Prevotella sp.]